MTRRQPERLPSAGARDRKRLIRMVTGVCRPPAGLPVCLGPGRDSIFQCTACMSTRAILSIGDEVACPSAVFLSYISLKFFTTVKHFARLEIRACSFGHFTCGLQSPCAVVLVGVQRTPEKLSAGNCSTVFS